MHPHEFRKTLLDYVDAYVKHDADHESTDDKAERKRIADRRRRAADGIARTCEAVAATLAVAADEGDAGAEAKASGGYRAAIVRARKALPAKAHRLLDGLPCDKVREWNPHATYRCPKCELVGPAVDAFGARLEVMAFDDANLARLRAWWIRLGDEGAQLADIQRERIEAFQTYPHPTVKGRTYAFAPFRQSNCNACRNEAAKRSAERRNASQCG